MYITISQLVEMGVMPQEIEAKISGGDWKTARPDPIEDGERRILGNPQQRNEKSHRIA